MGMAILGGIYFFGIWLDQSDKSNKKKWLYFISSLIFTSVSFLLKPYALFFTLPMFFLAYEKFGILLIKKWQLWIFGIISVAPLILWRAWILQFPEGIPVNAWLFNGNGIRFKPSFFYWIFVNRISSLILGIFGVPIFLIGIFKKQKINNLVFILSFIASSIFYITVLATGNVQHDYYQILIIPSIAIVMGIGSAVLLNPVNRPRKYIYYLIFLVCTILSFSVSWNYVKDYFNINNKSIIVAGEAVDRLTPKDAKVIANYNGDTSFLYQTKRKGWASFEKPIDEMIKIGAGYLVLVNPTKEDLQIGKTYKIVKATSQYVIFNLVERK